tara:strand:- start:2621 stop:3331 length:711 start_codon:yes stop_codon:yes gene_type:complete
MNATSALIVPLILFTAVVSAQQAGLTDSDRYLDISNNILHEPCLTYAGVSYKAQLILDNRNENDLYWAILGGAEVFDLPDNCVSVVPSVLTNDPTIPYMSYNIENLIISEAGIDTGLRYDVHSRADASRLDLGFSFDSIRERRVEEGVTLTGAGSVSFSGPDSFPFELSEQTFQQLAVLKTFSGTLGYDAQSNIFTVTFDSSNVAGDYTLTVRFNQFGGPDSVGLILVYPIEFHII